MVKLLKKFACCVFQFNVFTNNYRIFTYSNQFYEYNKCFNVYFIIITVLKSIYFKHYKGMVKLFNLSLINCIKLNMILNFLIFD